VSPQSVYYSNEWLSVNGGGLDEVTGSSYRVGISTGQAVAGEITGSDYKVRLGFWQWGCCGGRTGNVDMLSSFPTDVDSSDLGALVNFLFSTPGTVLLVCIDEADVDASAGPNPVDSSDLGLLVAYLFASPPGSVTLPDCP
jgi:hypothetical protein